MKYRIKSDNETVSAAQADWDQQNHGRNKPEGARPLDATIYDGELLRGDGFKVLDTPYGRINVEPGCTVMTDPDGNQFAVHPDDLATRWEAVP